MSILKSDISTINTGEVKFYSEYLSQNEVNSLQLSGEYPNTKNIAIVGARETPVEVLSKVTELSYELSLFDYSIVSGLAQGVDRAAHIGALKAKNNTIAVIGHGHDIVYPKENADMYNKISKSGCILSEYEFETPIAKHQFIARNRIIAAISEIVIIGYAEYFSGSITTANFAKESSKPIAVLGSSHMTDAMQELLTDKVVLIRNSIDVLKLIMDYEVKDVSGKVLEDVFTGLSITALLLKYSPIDVFNTIVASEFMGQIKYISSSNNYTVNKRI